MAEKIECDLCKKILDYKKTSYIEVYKRTSINQGQFDRVIDVCDECLKELVNKATSK